MKRSRRCRECNRKVLMLQRVCRYCSNFTTDEYERIHSNSSSRDLRNKVIVSQLQTGRYTLQQVGSIYGISRERVRQIYEKCSRAKYTDLVNKKAFVKNKNRLERIKFKCFGCGKSVTWAEGKHKHKYCVECNVLYIRKYRSPEIVVKCNGCAKEFHPFKLVKYDKRSKGFFCSMNCYNHDPSFLGGLRGYVQENQQILKELMGEGVIQNEQ